jgi:hypothetical protein
MISRLPISAVFSSFLAAVIVATSSHAADRSFEDKIESIVDQMNERSAQAFSDAIDVDALLARVFEGLEIEDNLKASYSQNIRQGRARLGENILRRMHKGSYARVLNVRDDGDNAKALVRYEVGNGSYSYHEYELVKDNGGNISIVDWLDYMDGYLYSAALRLNVVTYEPTAASVKGLVPEHQGSDEEYARFAEVISAYRNKDYQKFYSESATLSRKLRRTRFMHLLTCLVSRMTRDRNLYNDAYRELSNNFGDDPTLVLSLVGYYYSKRDYEEAMNSLRLLQDEFGVRDAALLTIMSRTALSLGNADEASVLADEAISTEPDLEVAYWAAIDAHVRLNHHSFAVMTARSLEEQFGKSLERARFEKNGMYADFVKSPQFKQWQAEKQMN